MADQQNLFKNPYVLVPFKYGVVGGGLSVLLFFVLHWFGKNPLISGNLFSFFFVPIFVFFSIKEFKKYYNDGLLHFWQGMSIGFFTYIILAIVSASFIWLYLEVANPEMLVDYITNRIELIESSKDNLVDQLGESTYEQSLLDVKAATSFDLALDDFIRKILVGFFITTIIAVILRQQPTSLKSNKL